MIQDIDFGRLYKEHMIAAGGMKRPPEEWDDRAKDLNRFVVESNSYVSDFTALMQFDDCSTLLDVGCGPGTIGLFLAPRLEKVYGLDYSQGMLANLQANAAAMGAQNVVPIQRAWEDDWSDVPECDLVVASRSTGVMDIADALVKLDAKSRRRVYLTSPVGGRFVPAEIYDVVGRPRPQQRPTQPDYIYIPNLLYQMGRRPKIDYIANDNHLIDPGDFDSFARSVSFSLRGLRKEERDRLADWYAVTPDCNQRIRGGPTHWAFIYWDTEAARCI